MLLSYSRKEILPIAYFLSILLVTPLFVSNKYWLGIFTLLQIYLIVCFGLNIVLGNTGQASLGHGALYTLGAYTSAILTVNYHWPVWAAFLIAILITVLVSFFLAFLSFRMQGFYLAMVTMAFAIITERCITNFGFLTGGPGGLAEIPTVSFGTIVLSNKSLYYFISLLLFGEFLVLKNLIRSDFGRICWAIHKNEVAASSLGINVSKGKLQAFIISAIFASIGGSLYAHTNSYVSPDTFSLEISFLFVLIVIIGGVGSIWGPIWGGLILVVLPEFFHRFQQYKLVMYGALLLLVIIFLPGGLVRLWQMVRKGKNKSSLRLPAISNQRFIRTHALGSSSVIQVVNVTKVFGGVSALSSVSLEVKSGMIYGLIGPNGSGKTTLINVISGIYKPNIGEILFRGQKATNLPPHKLASLGIGRTFQSAMIFEELLTVENIMIGFHSHRRTNLIFKALSLPRARSEEQYDLQRACSLGVLVDLQGSLFEQSKMLNQSQRRFLEIARALALEPTVLLLDEPAAGLSQREVLFLKQLLLDLKGMGLTLLVVEHHMELVMDICDMVCVLDYGKKIAEGKPSDVAKNPQVMEAYLGDGRDKDDRS